MADTKSVHCDRRPIVRITAKSATAVVLAVLISLSAAGASQASEYTPLGGATGCCRDIMK